MALCLSSVQDGNTNSDQDDVWLQAEAIQEDGNEEIVRIVPMLKSDVLIPYFFQINQTSDASYLPTVLLRLLTMNVESVDSLLWLHNHTFLAAIQHRADNAKCEEQQLKFNE